MEVVKTPEFAPVPGSKEVSRLPGCAKDKLYPNSTNDVIKSSCVRPDIHRDFEERVIFLVPIIIIVFSCPIRLTFMSAVMISFQDPIVADSFFQVGSNLNFPIHLPSGNIQSYP